MATIIDALVITLGLDTAGYRKGQRETTEALGRTKQEAAAAAKELEARGKQGAEFFGQMRNAAIGLFAVFTGAAALRNFGRDAAAGDAAVGRLSRTLGIATDRLSAYQNMAERVGGTREGVSGSFQSLQGQIEQFRLFGTPISGAFRSLGIELADGNGQQRPIEDIYRSSIEALRGRAVGERPALARELGLGEEAAGFANLPAQEFNRLFEEQRRLGTVTAQQAAAGQRLLEMWLNLSQAVDSLWRTLREKLEPGFSAVLAGMERLISWLTNESKPLLDQVNEALRWLGAYIGSAEFRSDMAAFGRGIHDIGQAIVKALRFFGLIPAEQVAEPEPASAPRPGDAPNALSPGIQGGIYRLRENVLGAAGIDVRVNRPERTTGMADGPANRRAQDIPPDPRESGAGAWWRRNAPTWLGGDHGDGGQVRAGRRRSPEEFTQEFGPMADRVAAQIGVNRNIILGQMAIESDWGRAFTGQNNPFNMTAARGADATEGGDRDGNGNPIRQRFQNFANTGEAADHYAGRLRRLWPGSVGAGDDVGRFAAGLRFGQQGGYASDPDGQYATWLARRAAQMPAPAAPLPPPPPPPPVPERGEEPLANPSAPIEVPEVIVRPDNAEDAREEQASAGSLRALLAMWGGGPLTSGAASVDPGLMTGARAAASITNRNTTSTNSSEVAINGPITIQTQATDARGIAQSFGDRLREFSMVDQATRGLA